MTQLRDLLEARELLLELFNYQMLKGVLDIGVREGCATLLAG